MSGTWAAMVDGEVGLKPDEPEEEEVDEKEDEEAHQHSRPNSTPKKAELEEPQKMAQASRVKVSEAEKDVGSKREEGERSR